MRLFKQLLLFLFVMLVLGLASIAIRAWINKEKAALTICPPDTKTLILGDSHARTALNPEFIRASFSSAQKAEELEYSYYKLKQALNTTNSLENIILTVSYFNFSSPVDNEAEMMKRYHRIIDESLYQDKAAYKEYSAAIRFRHLIDHKLPDYLPFGLLNSIIETWAEPMFVGGYELRSGSTIGQRRALDGAIQRHYYHGNSLRPISPLRTAYFNKIVKLCQQKKVRLWVINTPLHLDYRAELPPQTVSHYQKIMTQGEQELILPNGQELQEKDQADFIYLDYSYLYLPDAYFFDYDHLNSEGASFFSQIIDRLVSRK